jgi:hypothetical protein
MKFRTIYILFNVVVVLSFLFVFFLPFFLLGPDYSLSFWKSNWYLALVFVAVIAALNAFFLANWRVFVLVEKEDWSALSVHLVDLIYSKKRYGSRHVGLLVNACLLQSDVEGISRLEAELAAHRPALLKKNAILFGVTRLLRNKPAEAEAFFADYIEASGVDSRDWLRFDYAFSLALQRRFAEAAPFLRETASSRDAVLSLLSAYLLGSLVAAAAGTESEAASLRAVANEARDRLKKRFPGQRWSAEVERAKGEIHIVVLTKLIDDAGLWLFESPAVGESATTTG